MNPETTHTAMSLSRNLPGAWRLLTRVDVTADGREREEASLGRTPIALLFYDRSGLFAAQFMRHDRLSRIVVTPAAAGANNSRPVDGYDAYFGTYTADDAEGTVTQVLLGALSREHVGATLVRRMRIDGDRLVIHVDTNAADGEPVVRTLTWQRAGSCEDPEAATP